MVCGGLSSKNDLIDERMALRRNASGGGSRPSVLALDGWGCESGTRSLDGGEPVRAAWGEVWISVGEVFSLLLLSGMEFAWEEWLGNDCWPMGSGRA